jgi:hypothetical protein
VGVTRQAATPRRRPDGPFAELLPWAGEQVADWEAAASAGVQLPDVSPFPFSASTDMAARRFLLLPCLCRLQRAPAQGVAQPAEFSRP